MREIVPTSQFKRDYKKHARETRLDELLTLILDKLITGDVLPAKFRDHSLKGG